ncbi:hypothetical protein [Pelagibacterium sp. H642]|uniref:hypothetical protein n=1 Tax=Pelagibacterium sp. H642 TaxID=1881069 RepID=UPI002814E37D|nr:hypothetical protein [Pelagibacterium sp. H642]WMT90969.1 hypothetical protein NO934_01570 [Pelagibacterium sp. H642]
MATEFVIYNPGGPDLEFEGECLLDRYYQGMGRLRVYETSGGKFILQQERNASRNSTALHRVEVYETFNDLAGELSKSWAGKDILERFGQPFRISID